MAGQPLQPRSFKLDVVVIVEIIDPDHLVSPGKEA
jgi:hypothetical protein